MVEAAALVESGRRCCARGDWSAALEHLTAARALVALSADDIGMMAHGAWVLGRVAEALSLAEQAHLLLRAEGRGVDAAMTAMRLSLLWLMRGDATSAAAWLGHARRLLGAEPDRPEHAYLAYLEASVGMVDGGMTRTETSAARLAELARRFPLPAVESLVLVVTGTAALQEGRTREGFALLDEAMLPVFAHELPAEWAGDIYCTAIRRCDELADIRRMEAWTSATERWSAHFGSESIYARICRVRRLELQWSTGHWVDAEERMALAAAGVADGSPGVAGEGYRALGEMRRMRGDVPGARHAFALAERTGVDPQPGMALLALHEGDPGRARMEIADALAERDGIARVPLLRPAVEIALAEGARREAETFADELGEAAGRYDSVGFRGWARHAAGMVALARGDAPEAVAALREAGGLFRQAHQRHELARVLALIGRAFEHEGDVMQAERVRAQAVEILVELGAEPIEDAPDAVGGAVRAGPLTARETEVLGLVAHGGSNRAVAGRLGISEKTVGRHLANIYLKLAVGSRTAAAAWWHARGHSSPGGR